jgi:hypothetical protein
MDFDAKIIIEWKELGFYYQRDDDLKQWWLIGSKGGLASFLKELSDYANDPSFQGVSEHIHIGPHQYLKIMTWHVPIINSDCIGGSLFDLKRLKAIIEHKLSITNIGEIFLVGKDYAIQNEYLIRFFVMADSFDPSSIEFDSNHGF